MSHYFENDNKELNFQRFKAEICGLSFDVVSCDGVFSKDEIDFGTKLLIESFCNNIKADEIFELADLGCGYGIVGMTVLKKFLKSKVSFFDINEKAVKLAEINTAKENERAEFFCADGIDFKNKFDFVVTNPPFRAGNAVLFKLFNDAYESLKTNGRFFVVLRNKQGAKTYAAKIADVFKNEGKLLTQKKGYKVFEFCKV